MEKSIVFFDTEISVHEHKILDIGAVRDDKTVFHSPSVSEFCSFVAGAEFICGHNVVHHDMKYIEPHIVEALHQKVIDTLYLSPLMFPKRPYHKLLKDDKLQVEELNNPVNDSHKASTLFYDEVNAFYRLSKNRKMIYCGLLYSHPEFQGFFDYVDFKPYKYNLAQLICDEFSSRICANADLDVLIKHYPVELAYVLALVGCNDHYSTTPPWLLNNYPKIENVIKFLCNTPCKEHCQYCSNAFDIHKWLKTFFGYPAFRKFAGDEISLQEVAAQAAVEGKSLLAVFPTGGGKSITFQLPALMAGRATHGLTVVISPLQSLMKDQVDNLVEKGIEGAVTINGMMNPIERADAIERVKNGKASLLYISPEQLRSKTIERLLMSRNIVRFVIDEAHCFSAWGQDFRVDYLYIGDFIRKLQKDKKTEKKPIPVSCFTATAKQKVISDICDYFYKKLDLTLEIFASKATRENLHYTVLHKETDEEKYIALRTLIAQKQCPTIVYVSRTKRTFELAAKLTSDGFKALPYNGKMDANDKIINQEAFMNNEVSIIVATSAFGMGVDKSDVKLVIHYDISDSLENYVQEAGRAGRDQSLQADCYVLFNENDLDKHFILLNQTKLSISQIQQVWKAIKDLTQNRPNICCSALEIARQAGWDDAAGSEMETRVRTAISALETAGYIVRGRNVPKVFATSIKAKDMTEASYRIRSSSLFSEEQRLAALRIIKSLISSRSIATAGNDEAESRIDYLADNLALSKEAVIEAINLMRQDGLLEDYSDMSAYINDSDSHHKSSLILERFAKLERFILSKIADEGASFGFKELNESAQAEGITTSTIKNIKTILYFLSIKNYIHKEENRDSVSVDVVPTLGHKNLMDKFERRIELCRFILAELYAKSEKKEKEAEGEDLKPVVFSLVGLYKEYQNTPKMNISGIPAELQDVEDALLYMSKIGALKLEGGFLVLYNAMEIKRIVRDNRIKYKVDDYRLLDEFYKQKIRQIHIVGEYANLMVRDYDTALQFVQDYFNMEFKKFIAKYFKGERAKEIERNITPDRYNQLFGDLSDIQEEIINDISKYIVVAAGPGSGKTKVLVHKLASLYQLEDVKHDQMLMLTFSRAAATEFKKRLHALIGNAANFIEIKTFHSYCFDLLGKIGTLEASQNIVKDAAEMIRNGEVEQGKITKTVLVIDEAQDMDEHEFALVRALMAQNDDMRIIAVGDDDQNIYEFRGSNSIHLRTLIEQYGANKYEMVENYRSKANVVALANAFAETITNRMKVAPVEPVTEETGVVKITRHTSANMEEAVVQNLVATYTSGRACVLTNTNDEALRIMGLLLKYGKRAKLIQSLDCFKLINLLEVRVFLNSIKKDLHSPVIPDEIWDKAKKELFSKYYNSSCIDNINKLVYDFEATHSVKYISDLEEFISESNYEDFYVDSEAEVIYVSTIHKSKGREFDSVYMMLKDAYGKNDEERRKLYVGMTRAKSNLFIHTNTDLFERYVLPYVIHVVDNNDYSEPSEIVLQTNHRDVVLDYFKSKKELIFDLRSGTSLKIDDVYLSAELHGRDVRVAKFSKAFVEKFERLKNKGYVPTSSEVRFIVAWKGEEDDQETPILLTDIHFQKQ